MWTSRIMNCQMNRYLSFSISLIHNTQLISLNLGNSSLLGKNKIRILGAESLSKLLSKNQILQILNLESVGITSSSFKTIVDGVSKSNLISLNVYNNDIGNDGISYLLEDHSDLKLQLQELNIGKTGISSKLGKPLIDFIHGCKLQKLNISNNSGIKFKTVYQIFDVIQRNQYLFHFNCQGVDLYTNASQTQITTQNTNFLKPNQVLKTLNLSNCNFSPTSLH